MTPLVHRLGVGEPTLRQLMDYRRRRVDRIGRGPSWHFQSTLDHHPALAEDRGRYDLMKIGIPAQLVFPVTALPMFVELLSIGSGPIFSADRPHPRGRSYRATCFTIREWMVGPDLVAAVESRGAFDLYRWRSSDNRR